MNQLMRKLRNQLVTVDRWIDHYHENKTITESNLRWLFSFSLQIEIQQCPLKRPSLSPTNSWNQDYPHSTLPDRVAVLKHKTKEAINGTDISSRLPNNYILFIYYTIYLLYYLFIYTICTNYTITSKMEKTKIRSIGRWKLREFNFLNFKICNFISFRFVAKRERERERETERTKHLKFLQYNTNGCSHL